MAISIDTLTYFGVISDATAEKIIRHNYGSAYLSDWTLAEMAEHDTDNDPEIKAAAAFMAVDTAILVLRDAINAALPIAEKLEDDKDTERREAWTAYETDGKTDNEYKVLENKGDTLDRHYKCFHDSVKDMQDFLRFINHYV